MDGDRIYLITGLGNPGKTYEKTRHNIGFVVVRELARKHGLEFRKNSKFKSALAEGLIGSKRVVLQMPLTFMNLSGDAVALAIHFWKIDLSCFLAIVDDVDIGLGELRLKINSGPGGHNGLKSIEEHLQSQRYARLRIGVGDRDEGDLASHVLGQFSEEQQKLVPSIVERAIEAIEVWLNQGITSAMNIANRARPEQT